MDPARVIWTTVPQDKKTIYRKPGAGLDTPLIGINIGNNPVNLYPPMVIYFIIWLHPVIYYQKAQSQIAANANLR